MNGIFVYDQENEICIFSSTDAKVTDEFSVYEENLPWYIPGLSAVPKFTLNHVFTKLWQENTLQWFGVTA